jgi:hypothetical protein|tara:strand:- start:330 stop:707 length:378 start_codon:yes stop_codon:yes gene_type:complete
MSLRAAIASAVSGAILATGDIAESITYTAKSAASYNASTGALTKTDTTYTIKAIIAPFGAAGLGDKTAIEPEHTGALSVLFASADLSVTPDSSDTITRGIIVYKIQQIIFDPAGATYRLIVERMG